MNKMIFLSVFILISYSVFAQEALNTEEIKKLKLGVKENAKTTKTIKSDFEQYKHLDFLSNDIKTDGKLFFKYPNLVKWEYTKPYQYSVVFKNNSLLINDGGKKNNINIGSNKMFKKMNELIVKSVQGDMFDDNAFTIEYYKTKSVYIVKFMLKDNSFKKIIKQFVLHFSKNKFSVVQVTMIEPSNDYTKIIFKNQLLNATISDAVFSN